MLRHFYLLTQDQYKKKKKHTAYDDTKISILLVFPLPTSMVRKWTEGGGHLVRAGQGAVGLAGLVTGSAGGTDRRTQLGACY